MGEDKDTERDDEPEREGQRVGVLVKGRPTSGGSDVKGVDEEERERWRRQVCRHKECVISLKCGMFTDHVCIVCLAKMAHLG